MRTLIRNLRSALVLAALVLAPRLAAQTASDACGYNVGNQYSVGSSCVNHAFNKPSTFGVALGTLTTCGAGNFNDAWGWFTATGYTTIITYTPNSGNPILHLFTASCGALTQVACANAGGAGVAETITYATTPGVNYMVRMQSSGNGNTINGNICIYTPAAPANDNPCGAISIGVNTSCTNTATTSLYATPTSSVPDPPCANYGGRDVWYSFTAPASGAVAIRTGANGMTDSGIALYSAASCSGAFTLLACNDDGNGLMSQISTGGLTNGTTYYVRVWGKNGTQGTFNICIFSLLGNDEPCGAVALPVNGTCVNTASTNVGATASAGIPAPGCAAYSGGDVWFSFVAPASGAVVLQTGANGMTDSGMALYSATGCSGTFTLLACDDDGNGLMSRITSGGLAPGTTYYIRVWGYNGSAGTFNICATTFTPPANDEPCGAIDLALGSSCSYTGYTNVNATGTLNMPNPGCAGYSGGDVWFRFTAPANGLVTIRTTAGTLTNAGMALYRAAGCDGGFTLVSCDNTNGPGNMPFLSYTMLDLVPGNVYYLRVWGNGGAQGTFNLCANTAPAGGSCAYALHLYDAMGDGWNGSYVTVQVGAAAPVNYTIANSDRETYYIPANIGDLVQLSYTSVGGSQADNRYVLQLLYGAVYQDGPTPGTGLRYAGVANCQSPQASTSDCQGRTPLCNSQQVNDNPSSTGLTADLHVNNRGCLGSNERQGLWYSFAMYQGGTVGFTIAPTNQANDYDFAVWGPFSSLSCPPLDAPIRCNYSGTTGNTGLSAAGVNPSEGASGPKWSTLLPVATNDRYLLYISNYSQSGLSFNLTWQLTNGADISCTLLPVELVSFTAGAEGSAARLDWITASELNSDRFVVERMDEQGEFVAIGDVRAAGFSNTLNRYSLLDRHARAGTNYYRLRQVDHDGRETLSEVAAVDISKGQVGAPYPNPANDLINVELQVDEDESMQVLMHDASGRTVRHERWTASAGGARYSAPLSGIEPGSYSLSFVRSTGEVIHAGWFIVQ